MTPTMLKSVLYKIASQTRHLALCILHFALSGRCGHRPLRCCRWFCKHLLRVVEDADPYADYKNQAIVSYNCVADPKFCTLHFAFCINSRVVEDADPYAGCKNQAVLSYNCVADPKLFIIHHSLFISSGTEDPSPTKIL